MGEAARISQRTIYLEVESFESTRHERIYAGGVGNIIGKARYRRESPEETSRELRLVDRKLRRTSLRDRRSNIIYVVLSALISVRTRRIKIRRLRF